MATGRPRFGLPLPANKIRWGPEPPTMFEMLESTAIAAPHDVPAGPVIGEGVGAKAVERKPLVPRIDLTDAETKEEVAAKPRRDVAALPAGITELGPTGLPVVPATAAVKKPRAAVETEGAKKLNVGVVGVVGVREAAKPVPEGLTALEGRIKALMAKDPTLVHPDLYVPSNRRAFKQFIIQSFRRYVLPRPPEIPDPDACAKAAAASAKEVKTFNYQSFVRDYIQRPSPYRGMLVYHGLGSGKTCTSIASMESLYNAGQKPVYIFTPASLSKNYRDEITKCGPFIFRTAGNHWSWVPVPNMREASPEAEFLVKVLGIPPPVVRKQKGAWAPDPAKTANFDTLSMAQRKQIQDQIYAHIDHRFEFIHYNGLLERTVRDWACNDPTKFDGATIVIDEVHNLVRTINNSAMDTFYKDEPRDLAQYVPKFCSVGRKYRISYLVYRMLCNSVGTKIIALSGTPLINYPHEIAILANMLAGDTRMVEAMLPGFERRESILKMLERHPEVDFAEIVPRPDINANMVRITPVPSGCRKVIDAATGAFRGLVRDAALVGESAEISRERDLVSWFARVSAGTGMTDPVFKSVTRLPDLEKPFKEKFVDAEQLIIRPQVKLALMARLSGLISYYKGGKADLMAKVTTDEVVMLDMSDLQLKEYTDMRQEEIDKEQKERKKKKPVGVPAAAFQGPTLYDMVTKGQNSTFKIFSRAACNFAFPNDIERPRPSDFRDIQMVLGVADEEKKPVGAAEGEEVVAAEEEVGAAEALGPRGSSYEAAIRQAIVALRAKGSEVFSKEMLPMYSPKFQAILDRMDRTKGPVLVYSQFKTLEGVGLFAMAMEVQKGMRKLDILPTADGGWTLTDDAKTAPPGTKFYITYTGDEDATKRNILKAVFNAAWGKIPSALTAEIKAVTKAENNQKGEVAAVFMITQSGAEGISLANVRQVHIMEPYWNYVRLEQVKGRAIRICSHMDLPPEERTVDVYTYIARFSDLQLKNRQVNETLINFDQGQTTDQSILTLSNAKKKLADGLFEVMQASAVDCELNANENGALACYRFAGEPTMEPLFHPLLSVHLENAEGAVRAR